MTEYRPHPSPGSHTDEEFAYPGADDGESPTAMAWHYLRVLRRHCWKILGFVLAVVAATLLYALQLTPLYESTALIELANLNPMTRLGSDMVSYNIRNEGKVIETQLRLINSPDTVEAVARDLGLGRSPLFGYPGRGDPVVPTSLPGLSATMLPGTYLLSIRYRSASPELCRDIANSVAKAYIDRGYKTRFEESRRLAELVGPPTGGAPGPIRARPTVPACLRARAQHRPPTGSARSYHGRVGQVAGRTPYHPSRKSSQRNGLSQHRSWRVGGPAVLRRGLAHRAHHPAATGSRGAALRAKHPVRAESSALQSAAGAHRAD